MGLGIEKDVLEKVILDRRSWEASVEASNEKLTAEVTSIELGGVPVERVTDGSRTDSGVILHLHGGGFTSGSPRTHRGLAAAMSLAAGCAVLLVDYRLAPEHPFPAAIDDAVSAYRALLDQVYDPGQIVVAGDSAGAALAVAMLIKLCDKGIAMPAAAMLLSPWLDLTLSGSTIDSLADADPMVTRAGLEHAANLYIAGGDLRDPLASPLFAHLRGLPPMLVHVGEREILRDDTERFAAKILASGGDATVKVWPGMWHVFHGFSEEPSAVTAVSELGQFARAHFSSTNA